MSMTLVEAEAFVALRLSPNTEPVIGAAEITQMLQEMAKTVDIDGELPYDLDDGTANADWTPTYSRAGAYAAIAEGWRLKAGRVAHRFDFSAPTSGGQFRLSQLQDQMEAQARHFDKFTGGSVRNAERD